MKLRILFAVCALFAIAADATAGPVRDRIEARRAARAEGCQTTAAPMQPPAYLPAVQPVSHAAPVYTLPQSTGGSSACPGGVCPPQSSGRFRLFR